MTTIEFPAAQLDLARRTPVHAVLTELATAARDAKLLATSEFRRLAAYVLEQADGRDRREPWTTRAGEARPVPRLRVLLEDCFGSYADLRWFQLNKTTNASGMPLSGMFPRMSASVARMEPDDFALIVRALLSDAPDPALLRALQDRGGRLKGVGVELFSRLCFVFRRDLFFVLPREWADASGVTAFIDHDLRRYCALCRNLRGVCDTLKVPMKIRGSVMLALLEQPRPPAKLLEVIHKSMGTSLARWSALGPADAYRVHDPEQDRSAMPAEFAAEAIRCRRGLTELREELLRVGAGRCAISGVRMPDLLEVAYVTPYPTGEVHCTSNALLLRSDLHTLWDLNLIGVEPRTLRIEIAPQLSGTAYGKLAGRTLFDRPSHKVSRGALEERWRVFAAAHEQTSRTARPQRASDVLSDSQVGMAALTESQAGLQALPAQPLRPGSDAPARVAGGRLGAGTEEPAHS